MHQLTSVLNMLEASETAAKRGDWSYVKKQIPEVERKIQELTHNIDPALLSQEALTIFNSVREVHARLITLSTNEQQNIKTKMASVVASNKAHRAYSGDKG